jgi:hypothetical protein
MPRLYRPHIPIDVKCLVVLRQLGEMWPQEIIRIHREARSSLQFLLRGGLGKLAELLGCDVSELRLDHDPPLAARPKKGSGKKTVYTPGANDPEHLRYRPHGAQHEGSHDVKTRIRGEHGQYSDLVLIKRERKRRAKLAATSESRPKVRRPKMKIPARANPWPPKGSRKLRSRR